jgi:hypothetical protein
MRRPDYSPYENEWKDLYQSGWSSRRIARRYNCSHSVVLKVLRKQGLTRSVAQARALQSTALARADEIVRLYSDGLSLDQVSEQLGINRSAVYRLLSQRGLMRSCSATMLGKSRIETTGAAFFECIDSESNAYWLGFICADGCVQNSKRNRALNVELSAVDERHLVRFADIFGATISRRTREQRSGKISEMVACRVSSTWVVQSLIDKGVCPAKSLSASLVGVLDHVPAHLMRHFVRGYFDGDGSVVLPSRSGSGLMVSISGNQSLLSRIKDFMVMTLGVYPSKLCTRPGGRAGFCSIAWQARTDTLAVEHWFYDGATIFLERKREIFSSAHCASKGDT